MGDQEIMPPETINERIAAMEPQVESLNTNMVDLQAFKIDMIKQLADLKGDIKTLSWKVSFYTGLVMVVGNQLAQWGIGKLLK